LGAKDRSVNSVYPAGRHGHHSRRSSPVRTRRAF
jgi:hypothetical protein